MAGALTPTLSLPAARSLSAYSPNRYHHRSRLLASSSADPAAVLSCQGLPEARRAGTLRPIAAAAAPSISVSPEVVERKKHELLRAVQDTQRGLVATPDQRLSIEEALVNVEQYGAGTAVDLARLDGTWRLNYTSASDVLVLFEAAARLPFLEVGQVFQKFECKDRADGGIVRNVVRWSVPNLLEDQEGATLVVTANFSLVSKRNIYLQFEEASVQDIRIGEDLQALIAPAILPRTFLAMQILQFIRAFKAEISLGGRDRSSPRGLYYLSYLDRDMLLGRSVGGGGIFIFTRAQPLQL